jgi:hypothetical protein
MDDKVFLAMFLNGNFEFEVREEVSDPMLF